MWRINFEQFPPPPKPATWKEWAVNYVGFVVPLVVLGLTLAAGTLFRMWLRGILFG